MSIVYLTSEGQNPHNFTNQFAQGIQLERGAEVSVMGYSGNLRNRQVDGTQPPTEMLVVEGVNDAFAVYHGETADGTDLKECYYAPFLVKLGGGTYTPAALGSEIEAACNYYEYVDQYKNGWTCTWDAASRKYTIKCGKKRYIANGAGSWCVYSGQEGGITPAAAQDTLIPFTANPGGNAIIRSSFLDLKTGMIGDTTQAVGSTAAGSQGYEINFTTTDTDYTKIQFSMGCVPEERATRCRRNRFVSDDGAERFGSSRDANLVFDGTKPINNQMDFAFGGGDEGLEWVGFFTLGMTIAEDGRVGIIETKCGVDESNPKDPVNRTLTWTATNIGVAGPKKLMMCPRYDAVNNYPVMEFLADVGAGYVSLGVRRIGGINTDTNYYSDSVKQHFGVVFDRGYLDGNNVNAYVVKSIHTGQAAGPAVDGTEPITLAWRPLGAADSLETEIIRESGLAKLMEQANMTDYIGFKTTLDTTATPFSVGWVSTEAITTNLELERINQPLIITSPDLNAKGYMGGGAGGMGAEAGILGVVRINGNEADYGFSNDSKDNWIHLNNTAPITLNSLTIILKDEMNREAITLQPNFNVWLKFRCNAKMPCPPKHDLVVGGTRSYY